MPAANPSPSPAESPSRVKAVFVQIHSFFIIPLVIAGVGVLLTIGLFRIVTGRPRDAHQALTTIARGSETERWQAALDLAGMLRSPQNVPTDQKFIDHLIFEYRRSASEREAYLRTYLALAMGPTRDPRFEAALVQGLDDTDQASRLAAIRSLGMVGGDVALRRLTILLEEESVAIVLESVIALGRLGRPAAVPLLLPLLDHPEPNIRWDCAIALANLGDRSGIEIINQLLDRDYFTGFPGVDINEQDQAIAVAVAVAETMKDPIFKENLERLSRSDANLSIANAALSALKHYQ